MDIHPSAPNEWNDTEETFLSPESRQTLLGELLPRQEEWVGGPMMADMADDPLLRCLMEHLRSKGGALQPEATEHVRRMAALRFDQLERNGVEAYANSTFWHYLLSQVSDQLGELAEAGEALPPFWDDAQDDMFILDPLPVWQNPEEL